jgi:hypothetical protein
MPTATVRMMISSRNYAAFQDLTGLNKALGNSAVWWEPVRSVIVAAKMIFAGKFALLMSSNWGE